jgi:hypothetical protein
VGGIGDGDIRNKGDEGQGEKGILQGLVSMGVAGRGTLRFDRGYDSGVHLETL